MNKLLRAFLVPISILVFDQIFKFLATKNLLPQVGSFFETISCNSGIAFSIQLPTSAFIVLWLLSIAVIVYLLKLEKNNLALLFILGGAISNIIDRIFDGCVTDYITLLNIPTFNFADVAITLGASWFVIRVLFSKK
ncbi:signal peptidase II [bacterium]|nr:signal peptidase II [bacterium]MBT4251581.1 signal peptidase II [bacterium]MBT4597630.1 signal peptidase II [bacterium]MBT6753644.1 signal peptidase II [bacterium]MBT7037781.1 signal peptidase II [bacterium]